MRLIAKKPCSFGGQKFFIGDEIPENLVADAKTQEKLGTIAIANNEGGVPDGSSGTLFTQEQVDTMIAEAVEAAKAEIGEDGESEGGCFTANVRGFAYATNGGIAKDLQMTHSEIGEVFCILQCNVEEGAAFIAKVESKTVLEVAYSLDSRKGIKEAAKTRFETLSSAESNTDESAGGNETTGTNTEGADT